MGTAADKTIQPGDASTRTLAIYWFAKLAGALNRGDFILATVAGEKLRRCGFDVRLSAPTGRRRSKGVDK